jgi:hypothetical protein
MVTSEILHKWIQVVKCTDVEPGETIRAGTDPCLPDVKEVVIEEVTESRIKFADGSEVQQSDLSSGQYWHKFVQSAW